jgi:hypothetical protein
MPDHGRQHWVAQTYLRAWIDPSTPSDQEGYVWRFPKDGGAGRRKSPKNSFWETDMYTVRLKNGERDIRIEQSLSTIEGLFTGVRDRVSSGLATLTDDDRATLCVFTAASYFRSRGSRDHHRGQFQDVLDRGEQLRSHMRAKQRELSPKDYQAYSRSVGRIGPPKGERDDSMSMEDFEKLRNEPLQNVMWPLIQSYSSQMFEMNLTLVDANDDLGFITSDAPTVIRKPGEHELPWHAKSPGLQGAWTEVIIPVSPDTLAMFSWMRGPHRVRATTDQQDDLNQMLRFYADTEIVVRRNETKPHWFTAEPKVLGKDQPPKSD